jgi:calcineurin-like phosphoesterase family protein
VPNTYFTSDTHFTHERTIKLSERPFANAGEMDEHMIAAWNAVVRPDDEIWHLGDFAYKCTAERRQTIFARLNGVKRLIRGNHDNDATQALPWASVSDLEIIAVEGRQVVLCHYPMREWPYYFRGALHFFGHCHNKMPGSRRSHDVGVDAIGYTPLRLEQLTEIMAKLPELSFKAGTVVNAEATNHAVQDTIEQSA